MSNNDGDSRDSTVLIPVNTDGVEELPVGLVELLSLLRVVVLGYYLVPDQASPEQLRADHEDEAAAVVDEATARFADRGAAVESLLVFTHDHSETIDRIAIQHEVDAVLTPGDCNQLDRVLVALRGDENLGEIVSFVADLSRESNTEVTLYNVADSEDGASRGEMLLRGICARLADEGVDPDRVEWRLDRGDSPSDAITAATQEFDLLVVGESEPSLRERIFGPTTGQVIERVSRPVLVVRDS